MPKEITHMHFAGDTLAHPGRSSLAAEMKDIAALCRRHPVFFDLGSVGPDILYYDLAMPTDRKFPSTGIPWSDALHGLHGENTMPHLEAMIRILHEPELQKKLVGTSPLAPADKEKLLVFALGYLTHAALDITLHPAIYYFSGNYYDEHPDAKKDSVSRHRAIETLLDLYVLEKHDSSMKKFNTLKHMNLGGRDTRLVMSFFALSLRLGFGMADQPGEPAAAEKIGPMSADYLYKVCLRSYRKHLLAVRAFRNGWIGRTLIAINRKKDHLSEYSSLFYPRKSYRSYLATHPNSFDLLRLDYFRDPVSGETRKLSVSSLYRRALVLSRQFLVQYHRLAQGNQPEKFSLHFPGHSLNNGRVGVPVKDMKYFGPVPINGSFYAS